MGEIQLPNFERASCQANSKKDTYLFMPYAFTATGGTAGRIPWNPQHCEMRSESLRRAIEMFLGSQRLGYGNMWEYGAESELMFCIRYRLSQQV
jgi:hypothetical protein